MHYLSFLIARVEPNTFDELLEQSTPEFDGRNTPEA